jgi:hypothetical protein
MPPTNNFLFYFSDCHTNACPAVVVLCRDILKAQDQYDYDYFFHYDLIAA